jgi:hypothetical protein
MSNVARLRNWQTSILVTEGSSASAGIKAIHASLSCMPFLNAMSTRLRMFWPEKAGSTTRRCRLWTGPSADSIPQPMRLVKSLRDCQGFSYMAVFFTICESETGSRVSRRSSHWVELVKTGKGRSGKGRTGLRPRILTDRPYCLTKLSWTFGDKLGLARDEEGAGMVRWHTLGYKLEMVAEPCCDGWTR